MLHVKPAISSLLHITGNTTLDFLYQFVQAEITTNSTLTLVSLGTLVYGQGITINNASNFDLTIQPAVGETIGGNANFLLTENNSVSLIMDPVEKTDWKVFALSNNNPQIEEIEYAYIYNNVTSTVASNGTVPFSNNKILSTNIIHTPGSDSVVFNKTGIYSVSCNVVSSTKMYFAFAVNGIVDMTTAMGQNTGGTHTSNQVIMSINAGDTLTVVNYSSAAVTLTNSPGGTFSNSANLMVSSI